VDSCVLAKGHVVTNFSKLGSSHKFLSLRKELVKVDIKTFEDEIQIDIGNFALFDFSKC
jgi:hypothetical protein